ncbi:hypothetical protein VTN77DRAFT_7783 [Rasamsonia byssochlamydoides]|uniref:uncharacterized protein n=1 Tax=Rasamsonia byssochlamydoides TaxID=89139 RepID=UPI003742CAAF
MAEQSSITAGQVTATTYATIVIVSASCLARAGLQLWKKSAARFQMEDFFVLFSWLSFLALAINTIVSTPTMYRVSSVIAGERPPYTDMEQDAEFQLRVSLANALLVLITLWAVKFSLLCLFRRLLKRLSNSYVRWWWALVIFTIATFIGCVISLLTRCSSLDAYFTPGSCNTYRDVVAQAVSLYYTFAVDVISDIMIMILPLKLIWTVQIPIKQKLSIGGVCCVGVVCIIVAIARVAQVSSEAEKDAPTIAWLAVWDMVEAGISTLVSI